MLRRRLCDHRVLIIFIFFYLRSDRKMANLLGYCNGDVVNGQAPLLEKVLSHISQSGCRVDGVASDTVLLEIRSRISSLCT
jgi:hypothetical protein